MPENACQFTTLDDKIYKSSKGEAEEGEGRRHA